MTTESKWAGHVAAWRGSGLTATAYCAARGLTTSSLRYWAKRLRDAESAPEVRLARVVAPGTAHEEPILIEAHGVRIAVRRGFDRDVLRDVLTILVERAA